MGHPTHDRRKSLSRLHQPPTPAIEPQMPEWKPRNTARARDHRNTATPAERLLWRYLAGSKLGAKFSRQMPVGPFFADFLCRSARLVIELDGASHDFQPERDTLRDRWFAENGYRILRFTNEAVLRDPEAVAVMIREELARLAQPDERALRARAHP